MSRSFRLRGRVSALAAIAAVSMLASACSSGGDSGTSTGGGGDADGVTLRLQNCVNVTQVAIAPLFIGTQLGFFDGTGVKDVSIANSQSTAQCIQLTGTGNADFTSPVPDPLFTSAQKGTDPGVQCTYDLIRRPTAAFVVDPGSSITNFSQLAGAKVGVNIINSGYIPLFEAALREAGVDPSSVQYVVTGYGAQVVNALKSKQVDIALYWDYEVAAYPALGYEPRKLELPESLTKLFSSCVAFNKKLIADNPDVVGGYLQGLTKSLIFAENNPEATVQLFWKAVPAAKPTNVSEADAIKQGVAVLKARLANNMPSDSDSDARYGAWQGDAQWQAYANFLGVSGVDTSKLYTDQFLDEANDVDVQKIVDFAKNYTFQG